MDITPSDIARTKLSENWEETQEPSTSVVAGSRRASVAEEAQPLLQPISTNHLTEDNITLLENNFRAVRKRNNICTQMVCAVANCLNTACLEEPDITDTTHFVCEQVKNSLRNNWNWSSHKEYAQLTMHLLNYVWIRHCEILFQPAGSITKLDHNKQIIQKILQHIQVSWGITDLIIELNPDEIDTKALGGIFLEMPEVRLDKIKVKLQASRNTIQESMLAPCKRPIKETQKLTPVTPTKTVPDEVETAQDIIDRSLIPVPLRLPNFGYTCFLNSTIKILSETPLADIFSQFQEENLSRCFKILYNTNSQPDDDDYKIQSTLLQLTSCQPPPSPPITDDTIAKLLVELMTACRQKGLHEEAELLKEKKSAEKPNKESPVEAKLQEEKPEEKSDGELGPLTISKRNSFEIELKKESDAPPVATSSEITDDQKLESGQKGHIPDIESPAYVHPFHRIFACENVKKTGQHDPHEFQLELFECLGLNDHPACTLQLTTITILKYGSVQLVKAPRTDPPMPFIPINPTPTNDSDVEKQIINLMHCEALTPGSSVKLTQDELDNVIFLKGTRDQASTYIAERVTWKTEQAKIFEGDTEELRTIGIQACIFKYDIMTQTPRKLTAYASNIRDNLKPLITFPIWDRKKCASFEITFTFKGFICHISDPDPEKEDSMNTGHYIAVTYDGKKLTEHDDEHIRDAGELPYKSPEYKTPHPHPYLLYLKRDFNIPPKKLEGAFDNKLPYYIPRNPTLAPVAASEDFEL